MKVKAILVDIDGTLVDSNDFHVLAWEEAFAIIGANVDRQVIHGQIGKGADMLIPSLLPNSDDATQKLLSDAEARIFKAKYIEKVEPFADARAFIDYAHALGQKIVLASSASQHDLDHYLDLLDIRNLVTATTCSSDVENTKPAPDIFSIALAKLPDFSAQDVYVVGDTPYDVEAAKKCGIETIGLRSGGFSDAALSNAGVAAIYDDVATLLLNYDVSPLGR